MSKQTLEGFALSPQQKLSWLQHHKSYHQGIATIPVTMPKQLVIDSIKKLIASYEVFRTRAEKIPGMEFPLQVIDEEIHLACIQDRTNLECKTLEEVIAVIQRESQSDIKEKETSCQFQLFRIANQQLYLYIELSSFISDAHSIAYILEELENSCLGKVSNEPVQYVDLAGWLNDILEEKNEYWQHKTVTANATFKQSATELTQSITAVFPKTLQEQLTTIPSTQLEPFLFACWQYILQVYFDQDKTCFLYSDGRSLPDLKGIIGNLEKGFPMNSLDSSSSIQNLCKAINKTVQEFKQWEHDLPFEIDQTQDKHPIFRLITAPKTGTFQLVWQQIEGNEHPLSLSVFKLEHEFSVQLSSKLEQKQASYLLALYFQLVREALQHQNRPLHKLNLLPTASKTEIIALGTGGTPQQTEHKTLYSLFEKQAESTPQLTAISTGQASITYGELKNQATAIAHYLSTFEGMFVGIYCNRSIEMIAAMLGTLQAGKAYIPLEPSYPIKRLEAIIENSELRVVLSDGKQEFPTFNQNIEVKIVQEIEESTDCTSINLDDFSNNPAYILYTSGSTGTPKGVVVGNQQVVNHMLWMMKDYPLTQTDKVLQRTPFGFDASVWEIFAPLLQGAQLVLLPIAIQQNVHQVLEFMTTHHISIVQVVPTLLKALLTETHKESFSSLNTVFCGGEPLSQQLVNSLLNKHDVRLVNLYGPTECTIQICHHECKIEALSVPIGKPIDGVSLYVLDKDQKLLPIGVKGELYIAGACVSHGYLNQADLTAQSFIPDHIVPAEGKMMYKSGDEAFWNHQGNLELVGRIDHQIKLRGFRIELEEIEQVITKHIDVSNAIAVVVGETGLESIACFYSAEKEVNPEQLRDLAEGYLATYMIPSHFIQLDEIPKTYSGKVDRKLLSNYDLNSTLHRTIEEPTNANEKRLLEIWKNLLKQERISTTDNFFNIGGHSLLAVNLATSIQDTFKCSFPLSTVFDEPTLKQQAQFLEHSNKQEFSCIVSLNNVKSTLAPMFLCPPTGGLVGSYIKLAQLIGDRQVYALQDPGLDERGQSYNSMEELAAIYAQEIKATQTQGSIILGGWSFGGLVALEAARKLVLEGIQIQQLILFDSYAPHQQTPVPTNSQLNLSVARLLADLKGDRLSQVVERAMREQQNDVAMESLLQLAIDAQLLPQKASIQRIATLLKVFKSNVTAYSGYICTPHPFEIHLFEPLESVPEHLKDAAFNRGSAKASSSWKKMGKFNIHQSPGHHLNMFAEPHVHELSVKLNHLLKNID